MAIHSIPTTVLSDRGKNFMAKSVLDFLADLGAKKVHTTPYKPSTNGSVERFHAYLAQAISHAANETHTDWDKHIDSALFAYRTTPLDGLDVSPFEILFGREPNLPIDNLLRRENWERTITTPQQHMEAANEAQRAMFQRVQDARAERFERNKKAAGADKGVPEYEVGEKVYSSSRKGASDLLAVQPNCPR